MKLIYLKQWGMGRAELIRLILAHVGAEYEDCRIETEEWEDLRPSKYKFSLCRIMNGVLITLLNLICNSRCFVYFVDSSGNQNSSSFGS